MLSNQHRLCHHIAYKDVHYVCALRASIWLSEVEIQGHTQNVLVAFQKGFAAPTLTFCTHDTLKMSTTHPFNRDTMNQTPYRASTIRPFNWSIFDRHRAVERVVHAQVEVDAEH